MRFNQQDLVEMFQGDEEIFVEIRDDFVETYPEMLDEISKAIDSGSAEALQISAHTLKGVLATFCALAPKDMAFELESMGRDGKVNGAKEKFDSLSVEVEAMVNELQNMDAKLLAA